MYITYETVAGNDPRIVPELLYVASFWHYTIAYIAPENEAEVYTKWLKPVEIPEAVAKSHKFAGALNGEISLRVAVDLNGDGYIDDIEMASEQTEKIAYFLTDEDNANVVAFLKAVGKNYVQNHSKIPATIEGVSALLDACTTLEETQMVMATYFDFDVAYTHGKEKVQAFEVDWDSL